MNKIQWRSQWRIRRDRIPQMILVLALGAIPVSFTAAWVSDQFRLWQAGGKWCVQIAPSGEEKVLYGSECSGFR
ncbi:hypothetical protein [Leptolyngbya sp. FACHB-17]|uniref:hypothetical protein n=1 Tax=unclassified Leptolyngbya TaxID=2650499 RepID=UPI0016815015|nr:hypothetical protein [Leptolyngbya sp. FACHB-17]MBD2082692.1 hypothetical protein [Leptolyngbya sp. FACHB-17]